MSSIKCFDVANIVIEEATKRFLPLWNVSNDKLNMLKQYCEAIDFLCENFNGTSYTVEVDDIKMFISVTLSCEDIIPENYFLIFYVLSNRGISVRFSVSEDSELNVSFLFPSLWERA